jgi:hypothetical protein
MSDKKTARVCFLIATFFIEIVDKVEEIEETGKPILGDMNTRNKIGISEFRSARSAN